MKHNDIHASFRDPSGNLFLQDGILYRAVNFSYKSNYDYLMNSGLYDALIKDDLLITHNEVGLPEKSSKGIYKFLKPTVVPFISYPYEWSFEQLKDAALHTLKIQKMAMNYGMSLKDASAYNIQFHNGFPILIDTLSFELYEKGKPWVAYQQFCRHFLAPLALMKYKDSRLVSLLKNHIDGVPLDLASTLLPFKTLFKFSILTHIHLHAKSQGHFADKSVEFRKSGISKNSFLALITNLESSINKLKIKAKSISGWTDYYDKTNYSESGFNHKKEIVEEFIEAVKPQSVWDLGANTGVFSKIASAKGIHTLSFDYEHSAVNENYLKCKKTNDANILPLVLDLTNPSPAIGWANRERDSFVERGPADTVMALALIHHLAISNNVPLGQIAEFFSNMCSNLIIEFIPKNDSQIQRLLKTRKDIFNNYNRDSFENEFKNYFTITRTRQLKDSERVLYLMKNTMLPHQKSAKGIEQTT